MAIIKVITPSVTDANITTAKVTDNAITLAKMASGTDGNIISYDASGNPVAVATGNDGQVLTSTGAGSPPVFETAAAGGKINQVIYHSNATMSSMTSSSFAAISGYSLAITPSASDSRIFLTYYLSVGINAESYAFFQSFRDTTRIQSQNNAGSRIGCTVAHGRNDGASASAQTMTVCFNVVDSPNTTNEVTYTVKAASYGGTTMTFNRTPNDSNNNQAARPTSGITAMEILA
jgi:hypothetical protein